VNRGRTPRLIDGKSLAAVRPQVSATASTTRERGVGPWTTAIPDQCRSEAATRADASRPSFPRASSTHRRAGGPFCGGVTALCRSAIVFFRLAGVELGVFLFAVLLGATGLGIFLGHRVRHLSDSLKEPFGIPQGALLGLVGLLLAFGLSLAVSR
jgi:hypothetical protein